MEQALATRDTNRRALLMFTGTLAALVIIVAVVVVLLLRQQLENDLREDLRIELSLLGELTTDALLRSDYAVVEGIVQRWMDRHPHFTELTASMPNGFVLATARKPQIATDPVTVQEEVRFRDRLLIKLQATEDFAGKADAFVAIMLHATVVAVVLILLLSWLLWWTLKRTALMPLENQIRIRKQKERDLLVRTGELETAIRELESFSYSVSHDLRTPLRAIDGFALVLQEDYGGVLDDMALRYLSRIRAASQHQGKLIDGLLMLAQVSRRELVKLPVDLSDLARQTSQQLCQQEPSRNVDIRVAERLNAQADPTLLHVVLENLLGNAWKYTCRTDNARIEFDAVVENGETVYRIRDNGAGFDMQYADKLFGAFQRLHGSEFPGTGIGLATVARIIHRHGGRIWAEGKPGEGAGFFFTLGT